MMFGAPWIDDPVAAVRRPPSWSSSASTSCARVVTWAVYLRRGSRSREAAGLMPDTARERPSRERRRDASSTHCPYCALQCGMTAGAGDGARWRCGRGRSSRSTRAACAARAGRRPRCSATASGSPPRWCATARPASCAPVGWDEALDRSPPRLRRAAGRARPRRRRRLRRRRADQREGLPARQVRPGRARHQPDRLQRPLLHVLGRRRPATAPSASTAACRSR